MNHRRQALQEILDLLKAEGWNPEDAGEDFPAREAVKRTIIRPNSILVAICFAAVATNFILIGANHDLVNARGRHGAGDRA